MLLSHHSSNPLEAGTDDPVNTAYKKMLNDALDSQDDSDLYNYSSPDKYQDQLRRTISGLDHKELADAWKQAAHDENLLSDDELAISETREVNDPERTIVVMEPGPDEDVEMARFESPLTPLSDDDANEDTAVTNYDAPIVLEEIHRYSSSRPSSPIPSSGSLSGKPAEERADIEKEIEMLYRAVPSLQDDYEVIDRLGTGTFSSVYKAIDLRYNERWNYPWLGHHPHDSSAYYQTAGPLYKGRGGRGDIDAPQTEEDPGRVYVAIKRIYNTSSPERIRNELHILAECRSCRHTSQIITAFRHEDQIVVVLPYQRHVDFRDYFTTISLEGIKVYLRCLLRALRDIHMRRVIHRDVKPANFLFDPFTGIGTLCDFGLASMFDEGLTAGLCFHTPPTPENPYGVHRTMSEETTMIIKMAQKAARAQSERDADRVGWPQNDPRPVSKANRAGTRGFRAPEVLLKCGAQSGAIDVWSAGVILLFFLCGKYPLFQSNDDIEGLMEIAVIIGKKRLEKAATLHSRTVTTNVPSITQDGITWTEFVRRLNPDLWKGRDIDMRLYPFNAKHRDGRDLEKSAEQGSGWDGIPKGAPERRESSIYGREGGREDSRESEGEASEIEDDDPFLDKVANARRKKASAKLPKRKPDSRSSKGVESDDRPMTQYDRDLTNALDLLERLLEPYTVKRITPHDALYHPFLAEPEPGYEGAIEEQVAARPSSRASSTSVAKRNSAPAAGPSSSSTSWKTIDPRKLKGRAVSPVRPPPGFVDDDDYVPHPIGGGACGELHWVDEEKGVHMVQIRRPCLCADIAKYRREWRQARSKEGHGHRRSEIGSSVVDLDVDDDDQDMVSDSEGEDDRGTGPIDTDGVQHEEGCKGYTYQQIEVEFGEGVPIGRMPCEYHINDF